MGSRFKVDTIIRLEDQDALLAFYAKWVGEEKAKWFLDFRFNEQNRLWSSTPASTSRPNSRPTIF